MKNESKEQKYFKEIIQRQRLSRLNFQFGTFRSERPNIQQVARSPHNEQFLQKRDNFLISADFDRNQVSYKVIEISKFRGEEGYWLDQNTFINASTFERSFFELNKQAFEKACRESAEARHARAEDGSTETTGKLPSVQ